MSVADPKRDFARSVVERLRAAGFEALWAGGCVRDLLMGRQPDDYDVATSAKPEDVRQLFGARKTLAVGASFGVIIVLGPKPAGQVEVATFRSDGEYADGRRPDRIEFADARADALRRDFTINGMFYDPLSERVLDYIGGEEDLRHRRLRAIGDPRLRFREDKLRLLRAARFTANLDLEIDPDTRQAVAEMAGELRVVSWERITQELRKMLVHRHRRRAVVLCDELRLLSEILPELRVLTAADTPTEWNLTLEILDELVDPTFELALAALLHRLADAGGAGRPAFDRGVICRRLKLSNDSTARIEWLLRERASLDDAGRLQLARLKRLLSHPGAAELIALLGARAGPQPELKASMVFIDRFLRETPAAEINPPPLITGSDLIAAGLQPGPRFRSLLEEVRDRQLDGRLTTAEDALAWVREASESGE
jgi:poly(A) polymerase